MTRIASMSMEEVKETSYLMDSYAAPNPTDSLFLKLRTNSTQFFELRDESILIFLDDPTAGYVDFLPVNLDIFVQRIEDNC